MCGSLTLAKYYVRLNQGSNIQLAKTACQHLYFVNFACRVPIYPVALIVYTLVLHPLYHSTRHCTGFWQRCRNHRDSFRISVSFQRGEKHSSSVGGATGWTPNDSVDLSFVLRNFMIAGVLRETAEFLLDLDHEKDS